MVDKITEEAEIIAQARDDPGAFLHLYERYVDRIYSFAYRRTNDDAVARDVTSATFEKALRHLPRYQSRGISFSAWLYRIARNQITDHYRQFWFFLPLLNGYPANLDVERTVQINQQHETLHLALSRLRAVDRELITLRYFDELSSLEVAEILDCSVEIVYLRLHRALCKLREQLKKLDEYSEVIYAQE